MKTKTKQSTASLLYKFATCVSILMLVNAANAYTAKETQSDICVTDDCGTLSVNKEIQNAMQATAANIHLWVGNRSYKDILKAVIVSSSKNRIEKIVEINHHLFAMSIDVGNLRMANESISIIKRFAPNSLSRLNQGRIFNDKIPGLSMFERLNSNSKFSNRELDLINNNFQLKNNEYTIGLDSFNEENSGEELITDSIYDLSNEGTGEVWFYAKRAGNRTDTLFYNLQMKMSQLSYKKSGCNLRYVAQIREAAVKTAFAAGAAGYAGSIRGKIPGAVVGVVMGAVAGTADALNTLEKEAVERDKCIEGAEDYEKPNTEAPPQNEQPKETDEDDDAKKKLKEKSVTSESRDADLQSSGTVSTELFNLLSDFYNDITIRQMEDYNDGILTFEQVQIEINSIANFGNKEGTTPGMSAADLANQTIQAQDKWTTPTMPLKQQH